MKTSKIKPHPESDEANAPQWPNLETQRDQSNKPQHSPLPWKFNKSDDLSFPSEIISENGTCVGHIYAYARQDANAALIVHAVNNVEALADLLRKVLDESSDNGAVSLNLGVAIEAALAAYEKGAHKI